VKATLAVDEDTLVVAEIAELVGFDLCSSISE